LQTLVIAVFLTILVALFARSVQDRLRSWFQKRPHRIFLAPLLLIGFCCAALWSREALNPRFVALLSVYALLPSALVYRNRPGGARPAWLDFAAILLLWLPVEFTTGKELLAPQVHSLANNLARGTAVTLGLFLFLVFRGLAGMKYNLPGKRADFLHPVVGFLVVAPVLIALGRALSFLGPYRVLPGASPIGFLRIFFVTLAGVAIPEELLFRALIQNWLMQRFGSSDKVLLAAALIFGAAHLNNAPGPLPNWRYMILATMAGWVYGKVFQKSSSILSSTGLHALVNTVRHVFFS
jgi:membrane protease YdiL (CAAX protease family)